MTTELKTFPSLWQVVLTAAVAVELWAIGPTWMTTFYRAFTALWLFTFAYAAIRNRLTGKETSR